MTKKSFTLVELFTVLILVSLLIGLGGIQVQKAIQKSHFSHSVTLLEDKLKAAARLSTLVQSEVKVRVKKEQGNFTVFLETDGLDEQTIRGALQKKETLQEIESFAMEGVKGENMNQDDFFISFFPTGPKYTKDVSLLVTPIFEKDAARKIPFSVYDRTELHNDIQKNSEDYPKEVYDSH